jgi:hypothetical protein
MRNTENILIVKSEGKSLLRRPRCRWEDSVKMGVREIGLESMDWVPLAQDRGR